MSDPKGKGKAAMESWREKACAACQHLQRACGPDCIFAPHFPTGDDPARFAMVHARFGADRIALILCGLAPEKRAEAVLKLIRKAQQPRPAPVAAAPPAESRPPCAACERFRQPCEPYCVYRPYYPPGYDPEMFARAYAVYEATQSAYEARRRHHDPPVPVQGVTSNVPILKTAREMLKGKIAAITEELARYNAEEAASRFAHPASEQESLPEMTDQEIEAVVRVVSHQVTLQSAADAVAGVTDFVTPLHEKLVLAMTPYVAGSSTGVSASTDIYMQQQLSEALTAAAGVQDQDPGLPEGEDAGDDILKGLRELPFYLEE